MRVDSMSCLTELTEEALGDTVDKVIAIGKTVDSPCGLLCRA